MFTALIFRVKYGQILSKTDFVGCFLIISCVVFISIGGAQKNDSTTVEIDTKNLVYAILSALGCGLIFSYTLNVNYVIQDIKFPPDQMNYDGNFLFGIILAPFFIYELVYNPDTFDLKSIVQSNLALFFVNLAINSFSFAMKYGKGASV